MKIFYIVTPGYLFRSPYGTSLGSPYDYDTHVPLIFSRKQFRSKTQDVYQATVNIAPTIAKYLELKYRPTAMESRSIFKMLQIKNLSKYLKY